MNDELKWCNWSFDECLKPKEHWLVTRDCGDQIVLKRGDTKNWKAYAASLQPHPQFTVPVGAKCPNCHKQINGVNPYDDGET
jgi:hypothetical protein